METALTLFRLLFLAAAGVAVLRFARRLIVLAKRRDVAPSSPLRSTLMRHHGLNMVLSAVFFLTLFWLVTALRDGLCAPG